MFSKLTTKLASNTAENSPAIHFRRKRFFILREYVGRIEKQLGRPLSILDVGGTELFWSRFNYPLSEHQITLLNPGDHYPVTNRIPIVKNDARYMKDISDQSFDLVFSNSVIEHLGTFDQQVKMVSEIRRVAKNYFIQTPSYYFPVEPHFLFPFFHWLPRVSRIWLIQHFKLGWYEKTPNYSVAAEKIDEINLLKYREVIELFPEAEIVKEKFLGLTKSYLIISNNS